MKIKVNKMRETAKLPVRVHYNDVGADVYYTGFTIEIMPHCSVALPLGFGLEVPDGYMANMYSRSGLAQKGIVCEMPPIDPGYRGEIHCIITNGSDSVYKIEFGDRIGQLVVQPIVYADFVTKLGDERGDGAFGSTGR